MNINPFPNALKKPMPSVSPPGVVEGEGATKFIQLRKLRRNLRQKISLVKHVLQVITRNRGGSLGKETRSLSHARSCPSDRSGNAGFGVGWGA